MARELADAVAGSLTALAAGDCLGLPVEMWHPEDIERQFGTLRDFCWTQTSWSDDTQQALILIEGLVREGRVTPDWFGEALVARRDAAPDRRFGLHRGTGRGFRHAVDEYARTRDWRVSADPDRVGNGAAMRIAPFAVALQGADDDLVASVAEVSLVTSCDCRSLTAAVAVARAARAMSAETALPVDAAGFLEGLARTAAEDAENLVGLFPVVLVGTDHVGDCAELLALLAKVARRAGLSEILAVIRENVVDALGSSHLATDGWALGSPIAAIAVAAFARDVDDALVTAVNLGGDADSTGAMVGGIVGAAAGVDGLPRRLRAFPGYAELIAWAHAAAGEGNIATLPDLLDLERRLSRIEGSD